MHIRNLAALWLICFALGACGDPLPIPAVASADSSAALSNAHTVPEPGERPLSLALGLDISASPDSAGRRASLDLARDLLRAARAGDHLHVRLIGADSYRLNMMAANLRVPLRKRRSAYELNPAAERDYAARVDSLRQAALDGIDAVARRPLEGYTDIHGFLAAGAEVIRRDSAAVKILIVTGDGAATRIDPVSIDLRGVRVIFLLAPSARDRTSDVFARREAWSESLRAHGAASVDFLVPGERVELDDLRASGPSELSK